METGRHNHYQLFRFAKEEGRTYQRYPECRTNRRRSSRRNCFVLVFHLILTCSCICF
ncbi:hypothetical protein BDFB_013744 [Asbolus verrucosus]|uniref:Uncharacterized protein n=1 Tax=Asbolus verrucosus TaxID=1661398 RepID=A0A482V7A8_ASBVE|nr:hypothetical protein BDFB_013744 [Asbolus verrucosus]